MLKVNVLLAGVFLATVVAMIACGTYKSQGNPSDTTSASEMATAVVAGSVNASNPAGTQASLDRRAPKGFWESLPGMFSLIDNAFASSFCPTVQIGGTGCTSTANSETLTYSNCSFLGSVAVWNGSQTLTETGGATLGCGIPSFPPGATLQRLFGSGTTRSSTAGVLVTLDTTGDATGWNTSVAATGVDISYTGINNARSITIAGIHTTGTYSGYEVFDHTIYTASPIIVSTGGIVTGGTVVVEHNLAKYVATATFNSLAFTANCCFPTSGSVSTQYSTGKTETMIFTTTCGVATLNGASTTLTECL